MRALSAQGWRIACTRHPAPQAARSAAPAATRSTLGRAIGPPAWPRGELRPGGAACATLPCCCFGHQHPLLSALSPPVACAELTPPSMCLPHLCLTTHQAKQWQQQLVNVWQRPRLTLLFFQGGGSARGRALASAASDADAPPAPAAALLPQRQPVTTRSQAWQRGRQAVSATTRQARVRRAPPNSAAARLSLLLVLRAPQVVVAAAATGCHAWLVHTTLAAAAVTGSASFHNSLLVGGGSPIDSCWWWWQSGDAAACSLTQPLGSVLAGY